MHPKTRTAPALSVALAALLTPSISLSQSPSGPATIPHTVLESRVDSGYLPNPTGQPRVVFKHTFQFANTAWLQFKFHEATNLPVGSFLRMTAKQDGGVQKHDGLTIGEWAMTSAAFNGESVVLELVAAPHTKGNHVRIATVIRGLLGKTPAKESICGSRDDRVQSTDKRQGRLWLGCTGWLIGPVGGGTSELMLTAGHCTSSTRILELNVPNSTSGGSVVRSHPNDQYPYATLSGLANGIGFDWQVCRMGKNSNTGLLPTQANGGVWYRLGTVPNTTSGQNITITGYGTSSIRNLTQVQKTHTGPLSQVNSTSLCYATDTTGGNSGSPIVHANTGNAIGIHTHAGCSASGGCNNGTRIDRNDLRNAIAAASRTPGQFALFGTGCQGTGKGPRVCVTNNSSGGNLSNSTAVNEYAYQARTSTPLQITGFEVYSRSNTSSSVTVGVAIYTESGGEPAASPIATGTITIGTTTAFYRANLSANVPAGTFYIAVDNTSGDTVLSNLTSGSSGPAFWRRPARTGSWALSGIVTRSSFRVLCSGGSGNAVPSMGSAGAPEIGTNFGITIAQGRGSATAVLLTGGSKTNWSGGSLPFSLAPLGAPGCNLLVRPTAAVGTVLNANGEGNLQFNIPNSSSLLGARGFHQWYVIDAGANALQVAVTPGAESVIGG